MGGGGGGAWRRTTRALGLRICTSAQREPDDEGPVIATDATPGPSPKAATAVAETGFLSPKLTCKTGGGEEDEFSFPSVVNSPKSGGATPVKTPPSAAATVAAFLSPRLQCKTKKNPRISEILKSAPASPRSPSRFALLKASLGLSKSYCGVCQLSMKKGQGAAIFTAECSHAFHFHCISSHVRKQGSLDCPVCRTEWKEVPVLLGPTGIQPPSPISRKTPARASSEEAVVARVYDDDEPLVRSGGGTQFVPIPEEDSGEDEQDVSQRRLETVAGRFQGVGVRTLPEAALVGVGRGYESYAVVVQVKAPLQDGNRRCRAPIDLIVVVDVSASISGEKLSMMKRAMRLVVSLLGSSDRLSIVAFSSVSKRLLPLRRMTKHGQRTARHVIDRLVCSQGTCTGEALRKAVKILEDRRERNPVASIVLLSDGQDSSMSASTATATATAGRPASKNSSIPQSMRIGHAEIPIHSFGFSSRDAEGNFAQCISPLLSVVVQDVRLQLRCSGGFEIDGVYSWQSRPRLLLHGSSERTGSGFIRLGDLYAEEERELLVEFRVPAGCRIVGGGAFGVKCCFRDPATQEPVFCREQVVALPKLQPSRNPSPSSDDLKNRFQTARAAAQAAHLVDLGDLSSAQQILATARSALMKSSSANENIRLIESELVQLHWQRIHHQKQRTPTTTTSRRPDRQCSDAPGGLSSTEALTPTSAWRAAERLAKVAMMRKSMNRVSDLHGFENARF